MPLLVDCFKDFCKYGFLTSQVKTSLVHLHSQHGIRTLIQTHIQIFTHMNEMKVQ